MVIIIIIGLGFLSFFLFCFPLEVGLVGLVLVWYWYGSVGLVGLVGWLGIDIEIVIDIDECVCVLCVVLRIQNITHGLGLS